MHQRLFFVPCLILALFLVACDKQQASADVKIGVVDMTRIMRECEPGKKGIKYLEEQQKVLQEKLNAAQAKLQGHEKDEVLTKELQSVYMDVQQRIQGEQQNVVNVLYDIIQRVMRSYRKEKGYLLLISTEAVMDYDASIDVTSEVIGEVNKESVEFKPLPEPPSAKDAPAPAEAPADPAAKEQPASEKDKAAPADKQPDNAQPAK